MTEGNAEVSRRGFLRAASAGAAATAVTGVASGAEDGGGGEPDFGGYLDDVGNFDGVVDETGAGEVTVEVGTEANGGAFGFGPAAVHVDAGTTVMWDWTGNGGGHNVVAEDGAFDSGTAVAEAGVNFEHTFEEDGVYNYYCNPHKGLGMKGSIVVGSDYPTTGGGGGGGEGGGGSTPINPEHMGVPFQAHLVGLSTVLAILATLVFTFYSLKYGESPNTKGGNN
jgi:halocyanin-like protein